MDSVGYGISATRRGSYDDAAASLRPHLRHLAQRRRSAPSLVFGKALGMSWSPIREEASRRVSAEQSPFVLGLSGENGELLLEESVQVTEGSGTKGRHLFLFSDVIVFAKLKSNSGYRLKHRVSLQDIWLCGFDDDHDHDPPDEEEGTTGHTDLGVTLVVAWPLAFCLVCFRSPEVKDRWLETLHRQIKEAKARAGCASPPPRVLMKVLSGSFPTKALPRGGMEQFVPFPLDGDAKLSNREERPSQPVETKWNLARKLRRGSSFLGKARRRDGDAKTPLFGQPLSKICPDERSLPKPLTEMLLLLRKKGPSTEWVFRKPCNSKVMRDVREQLNGGLEVDMDTQPVVMLVGLLKSFLKELPGSLLVSELYDGWMAALDSGETQRMAEQIRKMVARLPAANKLLLQHLVCVLHHILGGADANKMDAHNLAVCIAPTLLRLDGAPLGEQKGRIEKVTELTRFLIEHSEILGENVPGLLDADDDSLSSQPHDSAYDSTDPDGDGEAGESACSSARGEGGSSPSLSGSRGNASPRPADAVFGAEPASGRRCSEPSIALSPDLGGLRGHAARSHDDCSAETRRYEERPLKKQASDDSFLLGGKRGARPVLLFPELHGSPNADLLSSNTAGGRPGDRSCSSLESAASSRSDGSVFSSSPVASPACPRRANATSRPPTPAKAQHGVAADEKRRSRSTRVASNVPTRTRSVGAHGGSGPKEDPQRGNPIPCETLQEDSQREADPPAKLRHKPRPLSAIGDSRPPCRPPVYGHAVQSTAPPPRYGSMTVQDAMELERRSRPSSVNYDFPRRCSRPAFEEFSYAKESYV